MRAAPSITQHTCPPPVFLAAAGLLLAAVFPLPAVEAQPKAEPAREAPPERATPRATLRTFLEAINEAKGNPPPKRPERMGDAVACLDLAEVDPRARKDKGPDLAWLLLDVLDRTWHVNYDEAPDEPAAPGFRRALTRNGKSYGDLILSRQPNGEWLFDAQMVAELPALRLALRHVPLLAGLSGAAGQDPGLWLQDQMPDSLLRTVFLLAHWQWLGLLALIVLGVLADRVATVLLGVVVKHWLKRRRIEYEERELARAERPAGLAAMALLWWLGLHWLNLPLQVHAFLTTVVKSFAALSGVLASYRVVDVFCGYLGQLARRTPTKMDDLLVPLVRTTLKIFVCVFGLVFIASSLGLDVTTMLAGLGIGGLAFALAAKDTVENLFGSFTVLLDRPFQIGDWVKIQDVEGTVEEVGFRSTRLRTAQGALVTIPNSKLVSAFIYNLGAQEAGRIRCVVAVKAGATPEQLERFVAGVKGYITSNPKMDEEPSQVYFSEVAGGVYRISIFCCVEPKERDLEFRERGRQQLLLQVVRLAREQGVELA